MTPALASDREYGLRAEREFVALCTRGRVAAQLLQDGRTRSAVVKIHGVDVIAPDATIHWRCAEGRGRCVFCEIKSKYPTRDGEIGLEVYRVRSIEKLLPFADVHYTLKITARDERGCEAIERHCPDWRDTWVTCSFSDLGAPSAIRRGSSWVNGEKRDVPIAYWPLSRWRPLRIG